MRLKKLEIKGFKSFAEETVINFEQDVIGVVGPNGSGKSNVVDAIRWVLGEQKSKELRLDKMSSVIFNGTKNRKEGNTATVSLTFENTKNILPTEYHTVTITRILYRSGESEYRLNNVPCRLKDITSLFMDTGIGSNSYAIIALGMVDDILSDKENARRKMFEQAAGVSKYKARKTETLNKLESTQADLDRVEDLLFEINKNMEALEKQAKRTQKYFDMRDRYKELSIALAIHKVSAYKGEYKTIQTQLTTEEDRYRQLEIEVRNAESKLESEKKANLDQEQALSGQQRELNQHVGQLRGRENDKRIFEQRLDFVTQNKTKLADNIRNLTSRLSQLDEDIEYYSSEVNTEKRIEAKLEDQLVEAEAFLKNIRENHGTLKGEMEIQLQKQQVVEREIVELEKKKAINNNSIDNLGTEINRRIIETQSRREEIEVLEKKLSEIGSREKSISLIIKDLEEKENNRKASQEQTEKRLDELMKQLSDANRTLDSKRNEYKLTKSMVESLEGFSESIKFLNSSKDWGKKAPLLSDLFYTKEEYRAAIENYLEPYLNYFVVENADDAMTAIQLLSKSQKGKANFFLMDALVAPDVQKGNSKDWIAAVDVVEVEKKYKTLTAFLLNNVYIINKEVTDIQSISVESGVVLLSQNGAIAKRKASIYGGSVGLFEGKKIGRKKNLEILEKLIKENEGISTNLTAELSILRASLQDLKSSTFSFKIQEQQNGLSKVAQEQAGFQARLDGFQTLEQENEAKNDESKATIQNFKNDIENIDNQLIAIRNDANKVKENAGNSDESYQKLADSLTVASADFNEKNIAFIRQQNKVTSFQRELTFREKQRDENKVILQNDQTNLAKTDGEVAETRDNIDKITIELQDAYKQRKVLESALNAVEQNYYQARNQIHTLEENVRKFNRAVAETQSLVNRLKDRFNDIKLQMTSIGERLQVEFKLSINDIINQDPDPQYNKHELDEEVTRLKNRLDNYGEINPMAVEAFNEMSERHTTINTQMQDILAAKVSLLETIKEIEETATKQFMESFERVRTYFIDIFRSLFTEEDTADLVLENPAMPLESAINIIAKPKGKRPQSISQLSGGEKTLTATALLFALYLLKPAPFCIFDEVDAPLDDANIEKFNRIIKKFSKDSQFIIVTHNKATMAAVDIIYGVYMPEQGVSAVTPVDFRTLASGESVFEAQ